MRPRHHLHVWLLAVALVCSATASLAGDDAFKVIVNPKNTISSIDRDFLRDAYLKRVTEWGDGKAIRPIDLSSRFPARDRFTQDILKKTPAQLRNYWNQQIFSGKGTPPPEGESTADVIEYVLASPGAIGYLPASTDPGGARVVKVE